MRRDAGYRSIIGKSLHPRITIVHCLRMFHWTLECSRPFLAWRNDVGTSVGQIHPSEDKIAPDWRYQPHPLMTRAHDAQRPPRRIEIFSRSFGKHKVNHPQKRPTPRPDRITFRTRRISTQHGWFVGSGCPNDSSGQARASRVSPMRAYSVNRAI